MKIAFISYDFGEYCIRQASALTQYGETMLMLPGRLAADHMSQLDPAVRFHSFEKPRLRQPLRQVATIRALVRRISNYDPDVIHFQNGHLWFNLALPLLRRYPLVVTIHDPRQHLGDLNARKTPQTVMDFGFRRADRVIVHGEQLKQTVVDEIGIPAQKIHVIPHVAIGERPLAESASEDESLVLFFGRIWAYKGLDYLIRAEPLITAQVPDVKIVIAGEGEDFDRYRRMMVHPDRFIVHNEWITDEKRSELFGRSSVVVLPYVEATQSGIVPVAYTHSKPVVATRTGGLPEVVEDGRTGLLVPPRDEAALANAIVRLLRDHQLRRQMGAAGKKKLEAEASPEVVAQQTALVYRRAIDDFHSTRLLQSPFQRRKAVS